MNQHSAIVGTYSAQTQTRHERRPPHKPALCMSPQTGLAVAFLMASTRLGGASLDAQPPRATNGSALSAPPRSLAEREERRGNRQ